MEWDAVMRVLAALEAEKVDYAVIGGVALNLHGIVRATEDIDVFVAPTDENIARLRRALHKVYDDDSIDEISAEDLCGEYPAVRYVPPQGPPMDILTRLGQAFASKTSNASAMTSKGRRSASRRPPRSTG